MYTSRLIGCVSTLALILSRNEKPIKANPTARVPPIAYRVL
ncbi:hypothetical protein MnTg01_00662 [archaeon MnTg01]|nr:hypothetical protein MnTg01_00662 [archaeon MnTg01]